MSKFYVALVYVTLWVAGMALIVGGFWVFSALMDWWGGR